jgi:hypothetical protein
MRVALGWTGKDVDVTKFRLGRIFEINIAKPTALEIAALALVLLFVVLLRYL